MIRPLTLIACLLAAAPPPAAADILVSETFGGSSASGLNGRSPDVNLLTPGAVWSADPVIAANGQVNDGSNTDRGAVLDLGAGFAFAPDETYTLTLSWTNLTNAILFAGFSATAPNPAAQMQTQGLNFALRARRIAAGTDTLATWTNPGAAVTGSTVTASSGSATLTLETRSLADARFAVSGVPGTVSVDLTANHRYLWIAFEDPTSGESDARFTMLELVGPLPQAPPEPATVSIAPARPLVSAGSLITLTASPPDAEIRYTLDGSAPGAASIHYTVPFPLMSPATVRAVAIRDDAAGPPAARAFDFHDPIGTPNVVIIAGDDIGIGDITCYGGVNSSTPAIDSLAHDGIRFTQFTTTGPGSRFSQFALLTGRVAARSGLGAPVAPGAVGWRSEEWSLAEMLRRRGYGTAFVGEWLLGDAPGSHPNDQGFILFHGLPHAHGPSTPLMENRQTVAAAPDPTLLLDALAARAEQFIATSAQPFALVFQPPALPSPADPAANAHTGRVKALDAAVARILDAIASRSATANTLVLFLGDGGAPRTADGGSNSLLRDGSGTTWEGGIRPPLIARLPGTMPAGQMNLSLVWLPDIMPTLASLLAGELAGDRPLDGTARPASLRGARTRPDGSETLYSLTYSNNSHQLATVRRGKWKSHLSITNIDPLNTNPTTGSQLYNLHVDAEERINRAGSETATLGELATLAAGFAAGLPDSGSTDLPNPKPALRGNASTQLDPHSLVAAFSFSRPLDSIDDFYLIEHSADLLSWQSLAITPWVVTRTEAQDHHEDIEVRVPFAPPPFGGARRFVRLSASRPANP